MPESLLKDLVLSGSPLCPRVLPAPRGCWPQGAALSSAGFPKRPSPLETLPLLHSHQLRSLTLPPVSCQDPNTSLKESALSQIMMTESSGPKTRKSGRNSSGVILPCSFSVQHTSLQWGPNPNPHLARNVDESKTPRGPRGLRQHRPQPH